MVDLSFDSQAQNPNVHYLDLYGHGTHMAGIIAGNAGGFRGVAPDAGLISVKVGDGNGVVDVSQVIAGIQWVVTHARDDGMNIRVINLSFGTDSRQDYRIDPLAAAAEQAWKAGIVVVAAAGNGGVAGGRLTDPASDPYVLAVGADDTRGTPGVGDDVVPDWSSRGDGVRNPDLVAPGAHIVSLRDPGSYIDTHHPEGRVGDDFFKGSGTSQATAVVSGAAALLLSQRPDLTPDQVKAILTSSASDLPAADDRAQGAGLIDVQKALQTPTPDVHQTWPSSDGSGSLEAARGSAHVTDPDGNVLQGEVDVQGTTWSGTTWSGTTWSGGQWNGTTWSGTTWSNDAWDGTTWSGTTWSGTTWSGTTWSGTTWSGTTWSGTTWS